MALSGELLTESVGLLVVEALLTTMIVAEEHLAHPVTGNRTQLVAGESSHALGGLGRTCEVELVVTCSP